MVADGNKVMIATTITNLLMKKPLKLTNSIPKETNLYKKAMAKYQLDDMNNQISYLNKISYNKRNEIACLQIGVQELEGYVRKSCYRKTHVN
jgi:hypothetical protein